MSRSLEREAPTARPGAWTPLRRPVFRALWLANVGSFIGTWMHEVAAAWLMTSLAPSPIMVALVQSATSLPMFLLALPAGVIADVIDRRRLLIFTQTWMLLAAATLAAVTLTGRITPGLLLALTFALGLGAALTAPAWQAIVPELVPRDELPMAVAVNSVGFNIARAVGPTVAGLVIAATSPGAAFTLNAVSFLGVVIVAYRWKRPRRDDTLPAERFAGALRAGLRFVRFTPEMRSVIVRAGAFVLPGSALWALLPLVARQQMGLGPTGFGGLLGLFGGGALMGAAFLPGLRRQLSLDRMTVWITIVYAIALLVLAFAREFALGAPAMMAGGAAWLILLSSFNVAVQTAVPDWVRARALAVYMLVFFGGLAGGSAMWGAVAGAFGLQMALAMAGTLVAAGTLTAIRYHVRGIEGLDLTPTKHWPVPLVLGDIEPAHGPVMVTVEYRIDPARAAEFSAVMRDSLQAMRRRGGAYFWSLFRDTADPERYVEVFMVESWIEHLRQHDRVTAADRVIERRARSFHVGPEPPRISHLVAGPP